MISVVIVIQSVLSGQFDLWDIFQMTFSLLQAVVVTDHDIKKQEVKVTEARKRLEHAISALKE